MLLRLAESVLITLFNEGVPINKIASVKKGSRSDNKSDNVTESKYMYN